MVTPSRFEVSDEQRARNARGLEACRAAIATALARHAQTAGDTPLTPSDEIRQRALARATAERRRQHLDGLEQVGRIANRVRAGAA